MDLVQRMQYDQAFIFAYSERSKTFASRHLLVCPALTSHVIPIFSLFQHLFICHFVQD